MNELDLKKSSRPENMSSQTKPIKIYTLAGLGLDSRTFQNLQYPENTVVEHLDWIEPQAKESISSYASRIIEEQLDQEEQNTAVYLIGHSFGGVLMQEIAQQIEQAQGIILLSSIKSHQEKPAIMRWFYWLPIWWLTIKFFTFLTFPIWARFYGYRTKEARQLFRQMVARFSDRYFIWATKTIADWKPNRNRKLPPLISIHGTADQMFYYRNIKNPKKPIEGGNHFMPYHKSEQISILIKEQIQIWEASKDLGGTMSEMPLGK
jgi:pimeloyl-ACP methyl ester carboxylesterase